MKILIAECIIDFVFIPGQDPIHKNEIINYFQSFRVTNGKPYFRVIFTNTKQKYKNDLYIILIPLKAKLPHIIGIAQNILRRYVIGKGFFFHCSANQIHGDALVFIGQSGAGKSTISSMLNESFKKIADDAAIILNRDNYFYIYQFPMYEKNFIEKKSKGYKIKAIFFLKKNKSVRLKRERNNVVNVKKLYQQLWLDEQFKMYYFGKIWSMSLHVPCFTLFFPKDTEQVSEFFLTAPVMD